MITVIVNSLVSYVGHFIPDFAGRLFSFPLYSVLLTTFSSVETEDIQMPPSLLD